MPKVETFNRDLVIRQATEVFHEKGYNATSMQDLVDATGLNRSSIYNSFGSKLDLFLQCLKTYQETYQKKTSKVLLKATNSYHAIELLFDMYLHEMVNKADDRGCMITNCKSEMANQDDTISSFLCANQDQTISFLESLIEEGQTEQSINTNKSARTYALFLFSSLQGLRMTSILKNEKNNLRSIATTILQILT